jgi:biopolymer transport protein ExbB
MGGVFMWPLLIFSIATVSITIERIIFLAYHDLKMEDMGEQLSTFIRAGNIRKAKSYLEGLTSRKIGVPILASLVKRSYISEHDLEKIVETESLTCINSLENGFNFLTALGSLAPLTGFLGTVSGMIGAFRSIAEAPEVNAQIVANGIYEALITTAFGLIIALIAMVAHSLLSHVVDKFTTAVERVCSDLIMEITSRNREIHSQHHKDDHEAPLPMLTTGEKRPSVYSLGDYT